MKIAFESSEKTICPMDFSSNFLFVIFNSISVSSHALIHSLFLYNLKIKQLTQAEISSVHSLMLLEVLHHKMALCFTSADIPLNWRELF